MCGLRVKGQVGGRFCYRCVLRYTRIVSEKELDGRSYILNLDITVYNIVQFPHNYISYVMFKTKLFHSVSVC